MVHVYPLPYSTSFSPYSTNPTTCSPTSMLMTPTLIRSLRPFLPNHQILRNEQMSVGWPFLIQNPPIENSTNCEFRDSPLNSHNLTPILKSLWTAPYYLWKGLPVYCEWPSNLTSNSMPMSNLYTAGPYPVSTSSRPSLVPTGISKRNYTYNLYVPDPVPFHVCSSHMVPQYLTVPYSETLPSA